MRRSSLSITLSPESCAGASHIPDGFIGIFRRHRRFRGSGATGGFKLQIEDRAELGFEAIRQGTKSEIMSRRADARTGQYAGQFQTDLPQLQVDIDRVKSEINGVSLTDIFETLQN
ncbi:efflux RND transporter permease subunit [Salmonella enterica subsp. enterica]|nr:efflux RND transporter permease subunit [Salmonella enterica subsp. enterica]